MENVINIASAKSLAKSQFKKCKSLHEIRQRWGLSIADAGFALGVSIPEYLELEASHTPGINLVEAQYKFEAFAEKSASRDRKNLAFSVYPLVFCREILRLDIDQMAELMGYSRDSWKKFECNHRQLSPEKLTQLEALVVNEFNSFCS